MYLDRLISEKPLITPHRASVLSHGASGPEHLLKSCYPVLIHRRLGTDEHSVRKLNILLASLVS